MGLNMGTQINEILKSQGFNHTDYGRVKMLSTSTGLKMGINAYTSDYETINIDRVEDGTYTISKGMGNTIELAKNVAEENLNATLKKVLTI